MLWELELGPSRGTGLSWGGELGSWRQERGEGWPRWRVVGLSGLAREGERWECGAEAAWGEWQGGMRPGVPFCVPSWGARRAMA